MKEILGYKKISAKSCIFETQRMNKMTLRRVDYKIEQL
jgi:hypothetical protein